MYRNKQKTIIMKNLSTILTSDLREVQESFEMGLITPREKWLQEYEAKKSYRMLIRITKN